MTTLEGRPDFSMSIAQLYLDKPEHYIDHVVWEIVSEIPRGPHRVLDLGCGGALTGLMLKREGKAVEVVGVEISERAAARAGARIDKVIVANLEDPDLPIPEGEFDFIILADVLEHLIDPWSFLRRIQKHLSRNGRILATIPNVRCWRVLLPLVLSGQWRYEAYGPLDRSHLRFFSRKTMISLFQGAGLVVYKVVAMLGKNTVQAYSPRTKTALLDKLTFGLARDVLAPGYLVVSGVGTPS